MANEDDAVVVPRVSEHFDVSLRHKRTSSVDDTKLSAPRFVAHFGRNSMCAEYNDGVIGYFVETVDKYSTFGCQLLHNAAIVDDLLANVDGRAQPLLSGSYCIDGSNDA